MHPRLMSDTEPLCATTWQPPWDCQSDLVPVLLSHVVGIRYTSCAAQTRHHCTVLAPAAATLLAHADCLSSLHANCVAQAHHGFGCQCDRWPRCGALARAPVRRAAAVPEGCTRGQVEELCVAEHQHTARRDQHGVWQVVEVKGVGIVAATRQACASCRAQLWMHSTRAARGHVCLCKCRLLVRPHCRLGALSSLQTSTFD